MEEPKVPSDEKTNEEPEGLSKIKKFSDVHPSDLLERILADGGKQSTFESIYRISDSGQCNRDAFLCTALDNFQRDVNNRDAYLILQQLQIAYDLDDWSTSCWSNLKKAYNILGLKEKYNDSPVLLVGDIAPETGYSIFTSERISIKALPQKQQKKRRYHIDWWIFEGQDVAVNFKKLEV